MFDYTELLVSVKSRWADWLQSSVEAPPMFFASNYGNLETVELHLWPSGFIAFVAKLFLRAYPGRLLPDCF